jgi:hypothetical protein
MAERNLMRRVLAPFRQHGTRGPCARRRGGHGHRARLRRATTTLLRFSWLVVLAAACSCAPPARTNNSAPPVFGGQGAIVGAPREMPLPADTAADKAAAGPCAAPSPASDMALIDDFEDGDQAAFKAFQREGWWFAAGDSTEGATMAPPRGMFRPEKLPVAEANRENVLAAHLKAEGQKEWGAVWGVSLRWESKGIRCPLNASLFAGVRFRAKGPGTLRVALGTPETEPADAGGTCTSGCYDLYGKVVYLTDRWDDYLVRWDRLEQQGWGTEARFSPARIVSLQFAVKPADLPADFWVDDIAFVGERDAEALAAALRAQPAPTSRGQAGTPR